MSDLHLALLAVGVALVVGIIVYNRRQERAAQRRAEQAFASRHSDVLLDGASARREPTLEGSTRGPDRIAEQPPGEPDPRVDYVIDLAGPPISASEALEAWSPLEHRYGKRGMLVAEETNGTWTGAGPGGLHGPYSNWKASLQLVSRAGVIGEAELLRFRSDIETLASRLSLSVTAPEMRTALDAARRLDGICGDADVQVVLHITASPDAESTTAERIGSELSTLGLETDGVDRWVHRDADGRDLYAVTWRRSNAAGHAMRMTLSMDVPRTPDLRKSYETMVRSARHLASTLKGQIEDDNQRVLADPDLRAIGDGIDAVRAALAGEGIVTGTPLALRLFS